MHTVPRRNSGILSKLFSDLLHDLRLFLHAVIVNSACQLSCKCFLRLHFFPVLRKFLLIDQFQNQFPYTRYNYDRIRQFLRKR